ncbi:hypothetical protein K7X08_017027 [Anisodus acutangulus]|uniref:Guanine nucleotide-binding protein alpha subunit n=1 Tax=Anisodus acutangulus TaxID=402998 RepID=A0A9Q1LSN7_9SOLA|nr:hypothetical protein K7X08_017027 [Anisodus acutangulus]
MGLLCSRNKHYSQADDEENAQTAEIERQIELETKADKHIQKLLLLGAGDSGKSTIFKQIKLLFQTGFDEAELKNYIPVIHANVYQTIKILHDGSKELAQNELEASKYLLSADNKEIGEKLSEIGGRLDYPHLTKDLVQDIEALWKDPAIQETLLRGNELQVPDCAHYFMENLQRFSDIHYVPIKEDVLFARIRTSGVVEIQFSPVGENKKSGEVYRLFDVGGQRNERRKWIHLFEGVTAVIFCAAISEYDQTLFEDERKNRMMETKELFEWVLKQPCFEKTSFMLFLNKFDIFEQKVLKVPLNACEWFKDYQPVSTGKQEIEHAYEFVKKKFEESYFQCTAPDRVDRVFKIYRTTALDQKLVKKTFKLVDETLRRRNLFEAGTSRSKCFSKCAGALLVWFASGSNSRVHNQISGGHQGSRSRMSIQAQQTASSRHNFMELFWLSRCKGKITIPVIFSKFSKFTMKQMYKEVKHLQSIPVLSLAAALAPPFDNFSGMFYLSNWIAVLWNHRAVRINGHVRTGIEFPTILDNLIAGERNSSFTSEVLVGTGSRIMKIIRIKSLKVYAFGFYVHPFDVCRKLGWKYASVPFCKLNKRQDFYQDLLREDISMTVRLVVSCNGIKINKVRDVFEKSLRARLLKTNPDTDYRCLETFGSIFSQDIPIHAGTTISFRRTTDGHLITEIGGNHIGTVQSRELCRAIFDMYIGNVPTCEETKEEIGKNVASIIRGC